MKGNKEYNPVNEQMRVLTSWLDTQAQYTVDKIETINDAEKLFKYCEDNNIEFFDDDFENYSEEEYFKNKKGINDLLGYKLIN